MIGDILQPTHLLFVLVIALLVLGPKRLPEVGRSLGRGLRDFRTALSGEEHESRDEVLTPPTAAPAAPGPERDNRDDAPGHTTAEHAEPVAVEHAEPVAVEHAEPVPAEHAEPVAERAEHVG